MAIIKEVLPNPPLYLAVGPRDMVAKACNLMNENNAGTVLVVENEKLVGVFSERDLLRRVLCEGLDPKTTKIRDVMTKDVVFVSEDDDPEVCLQKMEEEDCRHLPVISDGLPVAILSIKDVMRYILEKKKHSLKMLEDYVTTSR
jgi:CBS domain-containing protein